RRPSRRRETRRPPRPAGSRASARRRPRPVPSSYSVAYSTRGYGEQRAKGLPGALRNPGGRRQAGVMMRDSTAEGGRSDAKPQRRVEDQRPAVDAPGHGRLRVDLERRRRPRVELLAGRTHDRDPENAPIQAWPRPGAG